MPTKLTNPPNYIYKKLPLGSSVKIFYQNNLCYLKGRLGWNGLDLENFLPYPNSDKSLKENSLKIHDQKNDLHFLYPNRTKKSKTVLGTARSLIKSQSLGVQQGHITYLKLHGLGHRVLIYQTTQRKKKRNLPRSFEKVWLPINQGLINQKILAKEKTSEKYFNSLSQSLLLDLGFSHLISYRLPHEVFGFLPKPGIICLFSSNKNLVTQITSEIRDLKFPESYTGKGISYLDEVIVLKPGKKN